MRPSTLAASGLFMLLVARHRRGVSPRRSAPPISASPRRPRRRILADLGPYLCVGAIASFTAPASAEIVRLAELERRALEHRPELEADSARARVAEADARKAASAYYPQFLVKGDSTYAPGRALVEFPEFKKGEPESIDWSNPWLVQATRRIDQSHAFAGQLRNGLELDASANLYDFGRTKAAVAAGHAAHESALALSAVTRGDLIRGVRSAYLDWLSSHALAQLAETAAREAEQRRIRVESLIAEGVRPKTELSPARADELLTRLEHERAEGELASARLVLEQAVGEPLAGDAEPDLELLQPDHPALAVDHGTDPKFRLLHLRELAADATARMYERSTRPQLGVVAAAGLRQQVGSGVFPLYSAGLTLNFPLWDGGASAAAAAGARAQSSQLEAEQRAQAQQRENALARADNDARQALARFDTAGSLVLVCQERLRDLTAGYELGAASIEQISQARALLRRAQTELLLAQVAHAEARLRVAKTAH